MKKIILLIGIIVCTWIGSSDAQQSPASTTATTSFQYAMEKLYELHFWIGQSYSPTDDANRQAIIAFQKLNGLSRTGKMGDSTYSFLMKAALFAPAETIHERHIEVDLDKQVLFEVDSANRVELILPVSSGSGERFHQTGDGEQIAKTPTGTFKIFNKVEGWKDSPLGLMYDPLYFSGGYAIHGDNSVPSKQASHGCIRIPMYAAAWMFAANPVGTRVFVYGQNPDNAKKVMAGSKPGR